MQKYYHGNVSFEGWRLYRISIFISCVIDIVCELINDQQYCSNFDAASGDIAGQVMTSPVYIGSNKKSTLAIETLHVKECIENIF